MTQQCGGGCPLLPEDIDGQIAALLQLTEKLEAQSGVTVPKSAPRRRIDYKTVGAMVIIALATPSVWTISDIHFGTAGATPGPAIKFHRTSVEKDRLAVGEPARFLVESEFLRACSWRWENEWYSVTSDGERLMGRAEKFASAHATNAAISYSAIIDQPTGLPPGQYVIRSNGTGDCGPDIQTWTDEPHPVEVY
jgi:hypothetical protein